MAELAPILSLPVRDLEPYVDLRELQRVFGYSERWWRYRLAESDLPRHRYGGHWRFRRSEVERWLREREVERAG